jgi:hypothetical protein
MRKLLVLIALGSAAFAANTNGKPDFTGNWVLNVGKSNFGKMPKPQGMTLKAAHKGDVLHSIQTTDDDQGPKSIEGDWFLDGKQHPVDPSAPSATNSNRQTQMSRWQGNALIAERRSQDGSYRETIRMTLSGDGKTATEHVAVKSPDGNNLSTLVWERK